MDLEFTDEQQFLREAVRGTVDREAPLARVREWVLGDDISHDAAHALGVRQGWTGIAIPEEAGGQGGGLLELAILAEELGRGAVPADSIYATLLATRALLYSEDDAAAALVESFAAGEATAALALPGGMPLDAPFSSACAELVLGAPGASTFVACGKDVFDLHPADTALVEPRRLVDRTRAVGDVTLAASASEQLSGGGAPEMRELAAWGAVLVAADALGAAERMLELTVEYVGQRIQFGVPVGSFQAVKHAAAEMLVAIEGTRAAVHYAAWAVGAGESGAEVDAWVAKARASRAASDVADKALFLHGAVGYTWEHDLQLLFKRAKSDAYLFGGPGLYDDRIADALELAPANTLAAAT